MIDTFYIGAYWNARPETLQDVQIKTFKTLSFLKEIDEQFSNWYKTAMSRKKALERKIFITEDAMRELCLQNVKKGELDDKGFSKMGFLMELWSGHKDEESSSI